MPQGQQPCPSITSSDVKAVLPKKAVGRQLVDGFDSYFDGLGWALTMFAAKQGWLGPEIGAQSRQIERTMAAGLMVVYQNPQQANSAAWAAAQTYPWQAGSRLGTGIFMTGSTRIGAGNGVLAGTAAAQGSWRILHLMPEKMALAPKP